MSGKAVLLTAAMSVALMLAGPTQAELITWQFGGVVTELRDTQGVWIDKLHVGDRFSGTCAFESTTPDSLPATPYQGSYRSESGNITLTLADEVIVALARPDHPVVVSVFDDNLPPYEDGFGISTLAFDTAGFHVDEFGLSFDDRGGGAFTNDALPLLPPPLAAFIRSELWMDARTIDLEKRFIIVGSIDILAPEPSVATLLLVGLCWLATSRRHAR